MIFFKKKYQNDADGSAPIFIGGDGRSGTTLLSVVLNSHPKLSVGPELHFSGPKNLGEYTLNCAQLLQRGSDKVFGKGLKENLELKPGVQFVKRCHRMGIEFQELVQILQEKEFANDKMESFSDRCRLINQLGEFVRKKNKADRWGIKIMREIKNCKSYATIWPNAQFIHIIRDGRDVAASQLIDHGTWGYSDIELAAKNWVKLLSDTRKAARDLNYFEIKYEDLVENQAHTISNICDFIGCDKSEAMLSHNESDHSIYKNPYNHASIKQILQPINNSAIGRYKKDLTEIDITRFETIAGDTLKACGYAV